MKIITNGNGQKQKKDKFRNHLVTREGKWPFVHQHVFCGEEAMSLITGFQVAELTHQGSGWLVQQGGLQIDGPGQKAKLQPSPLGTSSGQ